MSHLSRHGLELGFPRDYKRFGKKSDYDEEEQFFPKNIMEVKIEDFKGDFTGSNKRTCYYGFFLGFYDKDVPKADEYYDEPVPVYINETVIAKTDSKLDSTSPNIIMSFPFTHVQYDPKTVSIETVSQETLSTIPNINDETALKNKLFTEIKNWNEKNSNIKKILLPENERQEYENFLQLNSTTIAPTSPSPLPETREVDTDDKWNELKNAKYDRQYWKHNRKEVTTWVKPVGNWYKSPEGENQWTNAETNETLDKGWEPYLSTKKPGEIHFKNNKTGKKTSHIINARGGSNKKSHKRKSKKAKRGKRRTRKL